MYYYLELFPILDVNRIPLYIYPIHSRYLFVCSKSYLPTIIERVFIIFLACMYSVRIFQLQVNNGHTTGI
jgi:hypothetical protein